MKKWVCLVAILVICLGMCSATFAATSLKDVKGTKYEDAVECLVEIGLVDGYEDDTYRPNVTVTRAQMAKLMVISLGEEGRVPSANKTSSTFTDMNSNHWAYGYVNVAKDLKIINGYTDGSFAPDEIVTYAEATAMAIRALGYEVEVENSKEVWPNNYISYAKKLSLYDNIGTITGNKGAPRGDTAILLWNMLKTGVCTAKSQTNSGIVYGPGKKMLNKYKNFVYIDDGIISEVDFDDDFENAKVTITGTENLTLYMSDTDVLKYYGKRLTLLYNSKNKKLFSIEASKEYKEETGDITKLTSKKICIDDDEYTLPDKSNILLYRVESLSDAIEATVFTSGSTVKYILATGARNVQVGLVTESDITVSKKDGIKVKKSGSSKTTSYALIDEDDMPDEESIIIYYLNSDEELGILKEIKLEDADDISSLSSTKIKIGKTTYTYDSDNFEVIAATSTSIKSLSFKSIDEDDDLVYIYEYAGKTYLIVFTDAVEDEDAKDKVYNDLQSYIKSVASKVSKEASYSQATFAEFLNAYNGAKAIKTSDTTTKINKALTDLKNANASLKLVYSSSVEGRIAKKRAELRSLINGEATTIVNNKSKYTTTSYNNFYSVLTSAKKVLAATDNTESEVNNAYDKLSNSIKNDLVLVINTEAHKVALAALNTALERCKDVGTKTDYVESTYNTYKTAYDAAVAVKNSADSKTETEIKSATDKLNSAIDALQPAIDALIDELNALIVECLNYIDALDDYMPDTFEEFEKAYEEARALTNSTDINAIKNATSKLKSAKNNLELVDDVLKDTINKVDKIKTATNTSEALGMSAESSRDKLNKIAAIRDAVELDLEELLEEANAIAEEQGTSGDGSINIAIGNTKKVLSSSNSSLEDLVKAYIDLKAIIAKQSVN